MGTEKFKTVVPLLRCPVCGGTMEEKEHASLVCALGHCFDLAKKGYVNFAPQKRHGPYGAALFESRQRAFRAGFYDMPLTALCEAAARHIKNTQPALLDAGCGEGFYALGLKRYFGASSRVIGFDLEKEAVRIAARGNNDVAWLVADMTRLPLQDACFDAVFNVFSPAAYAEFKRVLKPGGVIVKAVPGERYLIEIRQAAQEKLKSGAYSPARVSEHFKAHWSVLEQFRITETLPVAPEQLKDFLALTPMLFNVDTEKLSTEHIKEITIDVEIMVGASA
ncbi:MAG: methyltransferase domain-containing protein [Clostridiaceae bacterium]|nr:methyltransferase domain-containing protein [Eubacteriales bacterium]